MNKIVSILLCLFSVFLFFPIVSYGIGTGNYYTTAIDPVGSSSSPETISTTTPLFQWDIEDGAGNTVAQHSYNLTVYNSSNAVILSTGTVTTTTENYQMPSGKLSLNQTYHWTIAATYGAGTATGSATEYFTIGAAAPSAPTNVHIVSQDSTDVSLGWDMMTGATSYQVTRNGTTVYTGTATSFTDSGLTPNTTYTYNVYAVGSGGTSTASSINAITNPGSLSITNVPSSLNFGNLTIDGTIHSIPISMGTIEVSDTTGTNSGWNVTMSATPFTSSTDATIKLPVNSLKLSGISQINRVSGSTNMPVSLVSSPLSIDNGTVKIVQAAAGNGAGVYDIVFPANAFTLAIDTSKKLITSSTTQTVFHSTLTITVNVGP